MSDKRFDRLLEAAKELLASRRRDDEVDAAAMRRFAAVVSAEDKL